jgi:signal transduction histidine kinase
MMTPVLSGPIAREAIGEPVFEPAQIDARSILAELPVPVIAVDRERKLLVANELFLALVDRRTVATDVLAAPVLAAIDRVIATGAAQRVDGPALAGSERVYRVAMRAMSSSGRAADVIVAFADVQDLDAEQVARASMVRTRDLSSTAHELRAQLMTLLLWENLLRSELLRPGDQQRALQAIRDSASSLSALVGQLLAAATPA